MARVGLPEGTVTVLFTDLVGSTELNQQLGDERARSVARAVERLVVDRIENHQGVLIKGLGDGVMAAFSSARRAVVCAREIQQAMAEHAAAADAPPVEMRIGLHTGEVINEDGDIHGETVIIAKRIEGLAPAGGILASESVHMVLGTARDELDDRGEFDLKGIAHPWRLYEVSFQRPVDRGVLADSQPTPYIGRADQREGLSRLTAAAAQGSGSLVMISGEAGSGKTRLAAETLREARGLGMTALTGACLDMERPPPYQPLVDQLEHAFFLSSPEQMRAVLGENAPEIATLMPALRQRYDDIPAPPSLPPEQERRYLLHGVGEFFRRACSDRPLALVFEDLHWADESTVVLLEHVASWLLDLPLLVIGTYRESEAGVGTPLGRALDRLLRSPATVELPLRPLGREDVAAMLAARAGSAPPTTLVDLVVTEADGNPFFVEEVFRHLRETGKLFDETGRWLAGIEIGETEIPRGVQRVVARRLAMLSSPSRRVLSAAAVIGRTFSFDLLATVTGVGENELFDVLEEAEPLNLIGEVPGTREAQYAFVHEQFRQSLLGELSLPRRQQMHLRVADELEAVPGTEPGAIAHHLELAGAVAPVGRTFAALVEVGRAALRALAFEDALSALDRALSMAGEDADLRADAVVLEARALRGRGEVDAALEALDGALEQLTPASESWAAVLLERSQLLLDQFRARPAVADLERLRVHHQQCGDRAAELAALLALARARYILSLDDPEQAEPARIAYEDALVLAELLDDPRSIARALIPTTWFTDYWPEYRPTAAAAVERALELAAACDDVDLVIDARQARLRTTEWPLGDVEESEQLLELLEARRDPVRLKEHYFLLMWLYYFHGQFASCVEACDRGMELAELLGTAPVQYGSIKALALTELGRFHEVEAALAQEVTDDDHPFGQLVTQLARVVFLDRVGALPEAIATAIEAHRRAVELSRPWVQRWLAGLLSSMGARLIAEGLPVPRALTHAIEAGPGPRRGDTEGEWQLRNGAPKAAVVLLESEVTQQQERGAVREQNLTRLILAETYLELTRPGDAVVVADRGLTDAMRHGQASLTWQYRLALARAYDALGRAQDATHERQTAASEIDTLAARIADPRLRAVLKSQPGLHRWTRRAPEPGDEGS